MGLLRRRQGPRSAEDIRRRRRKRGRAMQGVRRALNIASSVPGVGVVADVAQGVVIAANAADGAVTTGRTNRRARLEAAFSTRNGSDTWKPSERAQQVQTKPRTVTPRRHRPQGGSGQSF